MNVLVLYNTIQTMQNKFFSSIMNDLNTPMALAAIFEGIRKLNTLKVSFADAQEILSLFQSFDSILGIFQCNTKN